MNGTEEAVRVVLYEFSDKRNVHTVTARPLTDGKQISKSLCQSVKCTEQSQPHDVKINEVEV